LGLTFLHPDTNIYADSYSYSYSYAYETPILCSCRLLYWSHADSRIFSIFQHQLLSKKQVSPVRAELRIEFTVRGVQGSQSALVLFFAQLIAYRDAQYCMHLVVENKCVTSTCIYHSPRLCGHSVGLACNCDSRVVYSLFCIPPKI